MRARNWVDVFVYAHACDFVPVDRSVGRCIGVSVFRIVHIPVGSCASGLHIHESVQRQAEVALV